MNDYEKLKRAQCRFNKNMRVVWTVLAFAALGLIFFP